MFKFTDRAAIGQPRKTADGYLVGRRFGLYVVIGDGAKHPKKTLVKCQCDCGAIKDVGVNSLISGRSTRCKSCAAINPARHTNLKHGMSETPEYQAWASMKARCSNPNLENYARYGGRGISVCDAWAQSFDAFFAHMGPRPDGRSLDRIDVDGNYEPGNCRWATASEQSQNRTNTLYVNVDGKMVALSKIEAEMGLTKGVVAARIAMGWTVDRAISEPQLVKKPTHFVFGESLTTKEIIAKYGVGRQNFNRRIRMGFTAEDAIGACLQGKGGRSAN
ncbi:MAG: hypothetical protein U5N55_05140 [Cypionkella sp.]|nr:hypothetical protein [Cypionkella sp.]